MTAVDFGRAAADYGQWRQGFPAEFFRRLDALGVGRAGQRILDLGTGTGLLARGFARQGCAVTGLDPSAFTTALDYSREAWRGRVRASARVGASMDAATLATFDAELERTLRARFPAEPLAIDHRVFALVAWNRGKIPREEKP